MGVGKLRFKTVYLHNLNYHAVKRYVVLNYKGTNVSIFYTSTPTRFPLQLQLEHNWTIRIRSITITCVRSH